MRRWRWRTLRDIEARNWFMRWLYYPTMHCTEFDHAAKAAIPDLQVAVCDECCCDDWLV